MRPSGSQICARSIYGVSTVENGTFVEMAGEDQRQGHEIRMSSTATRSEQVVHK